MCLKRVVLVAMTACLLLLLNLPAGGQVTADPIGFALAIEEGGEAEVEIVLSNSGEDDVAFSIDYELIVEGEERRFGPRRDNLGDVLETFELPYLRILGLAWDGEYMWGVGYNDRRLICIDPENDFEIIHDYAVNGACVGMIWDAEEEVFWLGVWDSPNVLIYDREGDQIRTINMEQRSNGAFATDGEFFYWYSRDLNQIRKLDRNLRNVGQIGNFTQAAADGQDIRGMTYAVEHDEGHFWLQTLERRCIQVDVDFDNNRVNQIAAFNSRGAAHDGIAHDGRDLWTSGLDGEREGVIYDDGIREFDMLAVEPGDGVIHGNDSETVSITVVPEGYEAGVYNILIEIKLAEPQGERDDLEQSVIQISAVVTVGDPAYVIAGTVTDPTDDSPVEGVSVALDKYIITRFSDDEGAYALTDLPAGVYNVTFSAPDYLPTTEEVTIRNADIDLDVALLHAEFSPDSDRFNYSLEADLVQDFDLVVSNPGNGPLTYNVERQLIGDANADPWELRNEINAEEVSGDAQLNGVTAVDGLLYVSGGSNGEDINLIYVFNQEGELVRQFEQFFESRYGMRDLTYDGTLIWGADETILYGFTTEGELESTIEGHARSYRALAWDADRSVFWSADVTSDIFATDLDGNQVDVIDVPVETRVYGLSYWGEDPDGYCLYIFTRGDVDSIECQVNKLNVETSEIMVVAPLADVAGRPGGFDVTNQYDVYSWVVAGLVQGPPDRVMVWQLEGRRDWFQIEPIAGQIAARESEDFVVVLDATGLSPDNVFRGEIVFIHDGIGSRTVIPVTLQVVEGEVRTTRVLELEMGWNTVSVNLQPDEEDVTVLTQPLVDAGLLEIMKDDEGGFYLPAFGHNSIPGWFVQEGYMLKVSEAATLELAGVSVLRDRPIALHEGWQLISYYPNFPVEATLALSNIVDNLIIAKDGYGNFYVPAWDYSNLGDMVRGQGYYLKMSAEDELVYTIAEDDNRQVAQASCLCKDPVAQASCLCKGRLPVHAVTGENMSLLVRMPPLNPPRGPVGRETAVDVGVYAGDALVGAGVLHDVVCGIAVWGDDQTTPEIDGALDGQTLTLMLSDDDVDVDVDGGMVDVGYRVLAGEMVYKMDALAVVEIDASSTIPTEFAITSAYPNPFNAVLRIGYALPEAADVRLAVYDLTGRLVSELARGRMQAGMHTAVFDGSTLSSGVYLLRLDASGRTSQLKVALVK